MKIVLLCLFLTLTFQTDWSATEKTIQDGIDAGLFPGCVLAVMNKNTTLFKKAFGTVAPRKDVYAAPVS